MKIQRFVALACGVATLFMSCSSIYMPNVPATPMFEKQGEVYLGGHTNFKGNLSGNAAIAVANHVALIANGSYINYAGGNQEFRQHIYEGGLGYFTKFGQRNPRVLEVYAGYGLGASYDADTRATTIGMDPVEIREMDFDKIFVQVNYSTRREQIRLFGKTSEFTYGTAIRGSLLRMSAFHIDHTPSPTEENFFIEPIFYTRLRLANNFYLQQTSGFNFGIMGDNDYLHAGNALFTLGLAFKFGRNR